MNTSIQIKHSRNRGRHRQWRGWRILLSAILLVCLIGAAIAPLQVRAAETVAAGTGESVTDETSIAQEETTGEEEPVVEETTGAEGPVTEERSSTEEGTNVEVSDEPADGNNSTEEDLTETGEAAGTKESSTETPAAEEKGAATEEKTPVAEEPSTKEKTPAAEEPSTEESQAYLPDPSDLVEKIYGVDPFEEEYSAGYFCINNSEGHGISYNANAGWPGWCGTNTSRSDNIYIDHKNGANINGTFYDIREYPWMGGGYWYYSIDNEGANGAEGEKGIVYREFHFYEAGHVGDPDYEVSFRGVTRLSDNDILEGYSFEQGLAGIWLHDPTTVKRVDSKTWEGTIETFGTDEAVAQYGTDKEYWENYLQAIWVEIESTPERPLILGYTERLGHQSEINYQGNSITYHLVGEGTNCLPPDVDNELVTYSVTYGNYSLREAEEYHYYTFDGWYYDEALTEKVPDTIMVSEDLDLYGAYTKVAGCIDTEVVGGTITAPMDDVPYGEDVMIEYAPNEGYVLNTVTVDGEAVDPDVYTDAYIFEDLQDDHTIRVVYSAGVAPVKAVSKGGMDVENEVLTHGDEVRYSILVQNPTTQPRDLVVRDVVDDGLRICKAEDGGVVDGQVITWRFENVPAGGEITVHFRAAVIGKSTEREIANKAVLQIGGQTLDSNEVTVIVAAVPQPTSSTTHTTREETETIRTVNYEKVTVPVVAVPTVTPVVETVPEVAAPVVAEAPAVAGIAATGDDSMMGMYLAAAGAAAALLVGWFVQHSRAIR